MWTSHMVVINKIIAIVYGGHFREKVFLKNSFSGDFHHFLILFILFNTNY